MNIQLDNNQLLTNNIPSLVRMLSGYKQIESLDCSLINNINSAGLATLIYIKKIYNPTFINLSQPLLDMCSIYKVNL